MTRLLDRYAQVAGEDVVNQLRQMARGMNKLKLVHVNSTKEGGGVAEILAQLVPLQVELGIDARWEVISGNADFYKCTKSFHNGLQGAKVRIPDPLIRAYEDTNAENAERLRGVLEAAEVVFIHDPQPAPLLGLCPHRKGKWIWRCHIDASHPHRPIWKYLAKHVNGYDASVFSLADFARQLEHLQYLIPPAIDPFSEKNCDLPERELQAVAERFRIDRQRPLLVQVSRFDRFKDPIGVIEAYRQVKKFVPGVQLVLAGGRASDDPEGEAVLAEVRAATEADPDVRILLLPSDAHRTINALQRLATIVLQKSTREGFGLTVTEALWKGKPVIGGNTGGIRIQVVDHHTGFLVNSPEGAALRIRFLFQNPRRLEVMGQKAQDYVRENYLLTRLLREHLTLILAVLNQAEDRIVVRA